MRAVPQGTPRYAHARSARGAGADGRAGRSGTAAGTARLIGAIVAGGANSRFGGQPKGLAEVGGRRIIDRVADALRAAVDELLLVSNAPDAGDWLAGVPVIADQRPERGSLVGIHTALATTGSGVLVVAWDMPFVPPALLVAIRNRAADAPYAVLPEGPRGPEPFCAAYLPASLPIITDAIDAGDLRLTTLLARIPAPTRIAAAEVAAFGNAARSFFNVNSAADLAAAEQLARYG